MTEANWVMRIPRRSLLAGVAAAAVPEVARARSRRFDPEVTNLEITVPGLDPGHDGLRIAHLTDIHVGLVTPDRVIRRAVALANAAKPDLVALTGDFASRGRDQLDKMPEVLAGLEAPAFATLGNHDFWVDPRGVTRHLESLGYAVLRNEHTVVRVRGHELTVVGVDDGMTGHDDVPRAFRGIRPSGTRIALIHTPHTADLLPPNGGLLALAGHTHGGQVVIPWLTFAVLRNALGEQYIRGHYVVNGNPLYVSRGVGMTGPRLRIGSPTEVAVLTLRTAKAREPRP